MTHLNYGWDWTTHLPVIKFLVEEYEIEYTLEHGSGIHSTPVLKAGSKKYLGLEEDHDFRNAMIADGVYKATDVDVLKTCSGLQIHQIYSELSGAQKHELDNIYSKLHNRTHRVDGFSLLFVDGFTATRNVCINKLFDLFDFIVYHDTEPASKDHYGYDFCTPILEQFKNYIITTPFSHTGLLVRKEYEINLYDFRKYINQYCIEMELDEDEMDILIG